MNGLITLASDTGFDVAGAVTSGLGIVTTVFTFLMANPIALVLIGLSIIPAGFAIFKSMRRSVSNG